MRNFDIKKRNLFSIGPHLLGLIFMAIGAFTIASPLFMPGDNAVQKAVVVGTVALLFGTAVVMSYSGTFFDFENKRYKTYYAWIGFRIGKWERIPVIGVIKVFPHTFKGSMTPNGINPTPSVTTTQYMMALHAGRGNPFLVFEHHNKNKIVAQAHVLSEQLKTPLIVE